MAPGGHMPMEPTDENARALRIAGWLTGVYFFVELGIGVWTGSVAVLSDAFHTFSAVGGVLVAIVAGRFATRPATRFQTFGLIRAEIVGALVNGFFLIGMAVIIMWMGAMRLADAKELSTIPMLAAAGGGLVTEAIALSLLFNAQKTNINIRGAYWHIVQTFVGSLIIIVSALVIRFSDFLEIDPLLGMAFGLVLVWASWGIIRESLGILLDNVPKDLDLNEMTAAIEAQPGVVNVHHLHAWALTAGRNIVSTHVLVEPDHDQEHVQRETQTLLNARFGVFFSTIQAETEICDEEEGARAIDFLSTRDEGTEDEPQSQTDHHAGHG
jgi:cobalt-zinc-cadmium efflux system protein